MNALFIFLLLAQGKAFAVTPADIIPGFTEHPLEEQLNPKEEENPQAFKQEAAIRLHEEKTARFIAELEQTRGKITPNPKSSEMEYAEKLLDNPDAIINPACYKEPQPCETQVIDKTCEERSSYENHTCTDTLQVSLHAKVHPVISRFFFSQNRLVDLRDCGGMPPPFCSPKQLLTLHPRCEYLDVKVYHFQNGKEFVQTQKATCEAPMLGIDFQPTKQTPHIRTNIHVIEHWSDEDTWVRDDRCKHETKDNTKAFCIPDSSNACLDAHQTKLIQGTPVTRPCWGASETYRCLAGTKSTCQPLIDQGCSNTASICESMAVNHCDVVHKTFQCPEKHCPPDKIICPQKIPCVDGACDKTENEDTDDLNEGIAQLGALGGTAEEVAKNKVTNHQQAIFKGAPQECEKYILGLRDCCTDEGWGDWIINCPKDMQALQLAKAEHRAVYLGHYKHHVLGTTRFSYCVFPTRLAGIIQIEGRGQQLGISFGDAEHPDCRGLTPEEIVRLDFKALNLNPIITEAKARQTVPSEEALQDTNHGHIEHLYDKGQSHD